MAQGPEEVDDRKPWFTWVYLGPDWSEGAQPLASFVEQARGGKREYKNALGFVLPDPATFDRARASARLTLAARSLLDKRARYDLKPEQVAELQEKERSADRDLRAAVEHGYSRVALPMRAQGDRPWELEESDLRTLLTAGRRLHDRVTEAVAHRVFSTVTSAKLASLAGLGPDRQWTVASELVAAFFSYFDFTKLTSTAAIVTAISTGVADRKFAYVPGFTAEGPTLRATNPRAVVFGTLLPVGDVDLSESTALVLPELLPVLVPRDDAAADEGPAPTGGGAPAVGAPVQSDRDGPAVPPGTPRLAPTSPTDTIGATALRLHLDGSGLFGLNRALSWLREESESLDIEVTVRATPKGTGFDRVRYRNGVTEPLDEGGIDVHEEPS